MRLFQKTARRRALEFESSEPRRLFNLSLRSRHGLVIAFVFFVLATAIVNYPQPAMPHFPRNVAPMDIRSPVSFTFQNPAALAAAQKVAGRNSPAVLVLNHHHQFFHVVRAQLHNLLFDVANARSARHISRSVARQFPGLSAAALTYLHAIVADNQIKAYDADVNLLIDTLRHYVVVDAATVRAVHARPAGKVYLASRNNLASLGTLWPVWKIRQLGTAGVFRRPVQKCFPEALWRPITGYFKKLNRPTYRYNAVLTTQLAKRVSTEAQAPEVKIPKGKLLARRGQLLNPVTSAMLMAARNAYRQRLRDDNPWGFMLSHVGQALTILIITLAGSLYSGKYLGRYHRSISRGWALAVMLLAALFASQLAVDAGFMHLIYLLGIIPTLLTAIILVVAYDQRFALGISAINALLITYALGRGVDFLLTAMAGIVVLVFGLKEIRSRGKLIQMGLLSGLAMMLAVWALGLARGTASHVIVVQALWLAQRSDFDSIMHDGVYALSAGIAVGFLVLGFLPTIERFFNITTSMTLLELCDSNQPLLRRLAVEAGGTYNHSLVLGIMAEAAANAIGADGLLCRVGAYYHDIGKLSKPSYFIENQSGGPNRHQKLSPAMSLLIIVGHVKDGMELSRAYRLPRLVHQFIEQHHGTTVVEFFLHAARQRQAKEALTHGAAPVVAEADFRYPGPRPQTKEAAIVMICDGVEGIVRAMAEPTSGRIETVVHQMAMKRLMDGQFAECDLTLRELSLIEHSVTRTLSGVYHGRVAYPKALQISQPVSA